MVANPAREQHNREIKFSLSPFALRIWPHETVSAVSSRVSPFILHTWDESCAYSRVPLLPCAFRDIYCIPRTSNTSLEICFIDLAKAYDSVDRVLLWEILARFGVPPRMIKVIRMSHDGMRARVQLDDGDFSAWFNVCQGLRQGCVLSPLLFNIFFAAVITVVLQRFADRFGLGVPR